MHSFVRRPVGLAPALAHGASGLHRRLAAQAGLALVVAAALIPPCRAAPAEPTAPTRAWFHVSPTTTWTRVQLPAGAPQDVALAFPGLESTPRRSVGLGLWAPGQADPKAKAEVDVPEALKVGRTLPLEVKATEAPPELKQTPRAKVYCGCGPKVPSGQPVMLTLADMVKRSDSWKGIAGLPKDPKLNRIPPGASAQGSYTLRGFAGNVGLSLGPSQDFLDPVDVLAPLPGAKVNGEAPLRVAWKKVPRAKAYLVMALGTDSSNQTVLWFSSTTSLWPPAPESLRWSQGGLEDGIKKGLYLGADTTECFIPAGIFGKAGPMSVGVTALGDVRVTQSLPDGTPLPLSTAVTPQSSTLVMVSLPVIDTPEEEAEMRKSGSKEKDE